MGKNERPWCSLFQALAESSVIRAIEYQTVSLSASDSTLSNIFHSPVILVYVLRINILTAEFSKSFSLFLKGIQNTHRIRILPVPLTCV